MNRIKQAEYFINKNLDQNKAKDVYNLNFY